MEANQFEQEVQEYLSLKGKSTKGAYSSAFAKFLEFYRKKYGEDKGFGDFLDRIYQELKKPRRDQKRVAELELFETPSN